MVEAGPEEGGYERALEYNLVGDLPEHVLDSSGEDSAEYQVAYEIAQALDDHREETGEYWAVQLSDHGIEPVIYIGDEEMIFDSVDVETPPGVEAENRSIGQLPYLDVDIPDYETGSGTTGMIISGDLTDILREEAASEMLENMD